MIPYDSTNPRLLFCDWVLVLCVHPPLTYMQAKIERKRQEYFERESARWQKMDNTWEQDQKYLVSLKNTDKVRVRLTCIARRCLRGDCPREGVHVCLTIHAMVYNEPES